MELVVLGGNYEKRKHRKTPPTRKFTLCKCRSDADLWKGDARERKITRCRQDKYHSELSSRQIQSPCSMLYCVRLGDDEKGKGIVAHPPKSLFSASHWCFHLSISIFFLFFSSFRINATSFTNCFSNRLLHNQPFRKFFPGKKDQVDLKISWRGREGGFICLF